MRTIEEMIADSQKTSESALREAFEAGRASAHADLKSKFSALFAEIMGHFEGHPEAPAAPVEEHHEAPAPVDEQHEAPMPVAEYHEAPAPIEEHHETPALQVEEHHYEEPHNDGHYN